MSKTIPLIGTIVLLSVGAITYLTASDRLRDARNLERAVLWSDLKKLHRLYVDGSLQTLDTDLPTNHIPPTIVKHARAYQWRIYSGSRRDSSETASAKLNDEIIHVDGNSQSWPPYSGITRDGRITFRARRKR